MTKIAFIATNEYVPWGGSEVCWAAAAERMARSGAQVRVSVKDWGRPIKQFEYLRSVGCRVVYRSDEYRIPPFIRRQIRKVFPRPSYWEGHIRSVAGDADLVVISQGGNYNAPLWMEAALSCGLRYAVISQAANEWEWPGDDSAERLVRCYSAPAPPSSSPARIWS